MGRTLPGECRLIRFKAWHDARQLGNSGIGLKASDILVILVEMRSWLSAARDSEVYCHEPIWQTWHPSLGICDASESDVNIAKQHIDHLKSGMEVTRPSSTPNTGAS